MQDGPCLVVHLAWLDLCPWLFSGAYVINSSSRCPAHPSPAAFFLCFPPLAYLQSPILSPLQMFRGYPCFFLPCKLQMSLLVILHTGFLRAENISLKIHQSLRPFGWHWCPMVLRSVLRILALMDPLLWVKERLDPIFLNLFRCEIVTSCPGD